MDMEMYDEFDPESMTEEEMMEAYYRMMQEEDGSHEDFMQEMEPPEIYRMPLKSLYRECMRPTVLSGLPLISLYLVFCLTINIISRINYVRSLRSVISISVGLFICVQMFDIYLTGVLLVSALIMAIIRGLSIRFECKPVILVGVSVAIMIVWQMVLSPVEFTRIRGPLMIIVMKAVSLAMDSCINTSQSLFTNIFMTLAYLLDLATVIFGPWVSYEHYANAAFYANSTRNNSLLSSTILRVMTCIVGAVACLIYSSCILDWGIPDEMEYYYTSWSTSFRDAQSFRFSHYFVSFVSEASARLAGINFEGFCVVALLNVEFPRSLVDVVVSWNKPMHTWLKNYVFLPIKLSEGPIYAVAMTYSASAFLHGFNYQLAAILVSLGLYTYAEHELRTKLSEAYDACVAVRKCTECRHKYKSRNALVILCNFTFFCIAIMHLIYLGSVFNSKGNAEQGYDMSHTLSQWKSLDFTSPFVALITLFFAKAI